METENEKMMDIFNWRYACKKFDSEKKIPEEDFATILEAARLSPTSFGFEPWEMLVVRDEKLKKELFPLAWGAQNSLKGASEFVILLAHKAADVKADSDYLAHIMRDVQEMPSEVIDVRQAKFKDFSENDFAFADQERAAFDWASKQTYIVLANMMTVAAALGVDSCPIEGFNRQAVEELLSEKKILKSNLGVSVMVGFGYRAEAPHRAKSRRDIKEIVTYIN